MDCHIIFSTDFQDICGIHDALYMFNLSRSGHDRIEGLKPDVPPDTCALVLKDDTGACCGGIVWHRMDTGTPQVFVDFAFIGDCLRGTGWGKRLFDELEQRVRAEGVEAVELTTNTFQAPAFYLKLGYVEIGRKAAPAPLVPENIHYRFRKEL